MSGKQVTDTSEANILIVPGYFGTLQSNGGSLAA
jgi:hypothetical protein